MTIIAPSILSADFTRLKDEIRATEEAGADMLHIDIMDGHFVPNITIGPFVVEAIKKAASIPLDVHLMIDEPDRYIKDFSEAGADYLTVHTEASVHLDRTVSYIRQCGAKPGVSINPATPVVMLENILHSVDLALLMSVNPGFGGQGFISHVYEKIRSVRKTITDKGYDVILMVDGGVKSDNALSVVEAGADALVMGSAFYKSGDYKSLMSNLRRILN